MLWGKVLVQVGRETEAGELALWRGKIQNEGKWREAEFEEAPIGKRILSRCFPRRGRPPGIFAPILATKIGPPLEVKWF